MRQITAEAEKFTNERTVGDCGDLDDRQSANVSNSLASRSARVGTSMGLCCELGGHA